MICASCGAENAADARYCVRCGTEQPRAPARPARGATVAIVASCVIVLLAGYGGWKLVTGAWSASEVPAPHANKIVQVPAGNAPPPTDQSAAPLPPPSALPAGSDLAPESASAAKSALAGAASTVAAGEATGGAAPPTARAGSASAAPGARATPGTRSAAPAPAARPRSAAPARAEAPAKVPAVAAAPAQRMAAEPPSAPQVDDHWTKMSDDLSRCTREDFINRVICDQRVRIRYCGGYWGKVTQCPVSPSTQEVR